MNELTADSDWRVDTRCTNCDAARQLAPGLIAEAAGRSVLTRQPATPAEQSALYAAAFACPTRSIRQGGRAPRPVHDPYPLRLTGQVFLCGHNSPHTAGANSYLLRRPAGNLLMIDTPRWNSALAAKFAALGPVTDVLLTHRDHAAHGRAWADRFGARLWIHEGDLAAAPDADRVLRGGGPTEIAEGVTAHPLPGHTEGSVLYLADGAYCFSGDSFYWSRADDDLAVAESVTWYSVTELAASLARVAPGLEFDWLLPGHGGRKQLPAGEFARRLAALAARTAALRPRPVNFAAVRW
ncbi:MBL fold metallo-hydrolase [Kitasatospora sp. MMS16-BH015]|uniref:MBL fold metallo-hydrolase n=1 Tax=Kitasatospora sp. MMS16-BH015 TaxID=2018025 RepID=UPI000CA1E5BE|nr:MBL fold metallo-hydrolase [Kitasatospora sp. MMS16-BH015]AUG76645.1 MBL fold metallo-hydrolase [Kitasatospora sp. MMS16-BH015]